MVSLNLLLTVLPGALYAVCLAVITVIARRGDFKDDSEYFLAGRNFGYFTSLVSILATEVSVATMLIFPASGMRDGFVLVWLVMGYIAGRIVVAVLYLTNIYKYHKLSIYETMSGGSQRAQRALSAAYLAAKYISMGVRFFLGAYAMRQLFGGPVIAYLLGIAIVVGVYTLVGGLRAVVWADQIQGAVIVLMGLYLCYILYPGMSVLTSGAAAPFFDLNFSIRNPLFSPALFLGGLVLSIGTHGADQEMIQRVLATKTLSQAKKSLALSGVAAAIVTMLYVSIGYFLKFSGQTGLNSKSPLVDYVSRLDSPLLLGCFAVLLLSAAMSTLSAAVNTLGAIWKSMTGSRAAGYLWSSLSLVILVFSAAGFIVLEKFRPDFLSLAMGSMNYVNGALIGIFSTYVFTPRYLKPAGIFAAIAAGFISTFLCEWVLLSPEGRPVGWTFTVLISAGLSFAASTGTSYFFARNEKIG